MGFFLQLLVLALLQAPAGEAPVTRLAFGSCFKTKRSPEIWNTIAAFRPEALVLLGDNVYADTESEKELREAYARLDALPQFARLRAQTRLFATWDDHDYGANDAGSEYPAKEVSQAAFLDFLREPEDSLRRKTPGVYASYLLGPSDRRIQLLVLDTRTFRDRLERHARSPRTEHVRPKSGPYKPTEDASKTILGQAQWDWLERELEEPAAIRIVASSIQVVAWEHGWETWGNFPHERKRLLEMLGAASCEALLILSGDRHLAEISRYEPASESASAAAAALRPVIDVTSSSLNAPTDWRLEPNRFRVDSSYHGANFGTLEVDWEKGLLTAAIRDEAGVAALRYELSLAKRNGQSTK